MLYCCKKCINGVVKRFTSPKPCNEGGAVPCYQADPICGGGDGAGGGGGGADILYVPEDQQCPAGYTDGGVTKGDETQGRAACRQKFNEAMREARLREDQAEIARIRAEYQQCLADVRSGPGTRKCIKSGTNQCPEGQHWDEATKACVPDKVEPGKPCAGGYLLADDPIMGGGGKPWTQDGLTAADGWYRIGNEEAHMVWHKDWGFQKLEDAIAYKNGTKTLTKNNEGACKKGYTKTMIGGVAYCCPAGGDGGDGSNPDTGAFNWSSELQGLLARLRDRFKYLMDYPRGTTPEERQAIINFATQGIKRGERGALQSSRDQLARMGLLGSGFETSEADKIKRAIAEEVSNIQQKAAIDELDRRFQELMGTTSAAGNLMNILFSSEQLPEILSAARRGEGRAALDQLLRYFSMLQGGQGNNQYWQAILSQMGKNQNNSSIWDWLPYLPFLLSKS